MTLRVLQVVRRYGPVGGMEAYVWELSRALNQLDCRVDILCEEVCGAVAEGIRVHTLGTMARKPRWLAAWRFSFRVSRWVHAHPVEGYVIHSHEATAVHQVTTFHGPPFARIREGAVFRRLSLRAWASLRLEQREVCAPQVRCVIPNSVLIREMLHHYYPCIGARMGPVIAPGVCVFPRAARSMESRPVIGFVGREWKRKGLDIAVKIVAALRQRMPGLEFYVAGPEPAAIQHLFAGWSGGYRLFGDIALDTFYQQLDVLLHPARMEPFGMVITEAMSAGVPAVISDQCGARSEVDARFVLPLESSLAQWCDACEQAIQLEEPVHYQRSWHDVALEHLQLYQDCVLPAVRG